MQSKIRFEWKKLIIFLIPFIAFLFRLNDIYYGLPDGSNIYHKVPYFGDEAMILGNFKKLIVFLHTRNPIHLLHWTNTFTYTFLGRALAFLIYAPMVLLTRKDFLGKSPAVIEVLKVMQMTLSGRIISLIASFLCLILIYKLLKLLKAKSLYIWLALIYIAFNSADVLISIQSKANALMNLFILLCLYCSLLWLEKNGKKLKYLLVAAGFSALAMTSRLNGGLSFFIVWSSFLLQFRFNLKKILEKKKEIVLIIISFLITFVIAYPATFFNSLEFLRLWQIASGDRLTTNINWHGVFSSLRYLAGGSLGVVVLITITILSLIYFKKMNKKERVVAAWFYLYLLISCSTAGCAIRYLYPLLATYILLFYIVIKRLFNYLKKKSFFLLGITVTVLILIFTTNFFLGLSMLDFYNGKDIRLETVKFVNDNFPENSSIGTYLYPEFYAPYVPLDYDKYDLISYRAREEFGIDKQYLFPWWRSNNNRPDYLVVERRGYWDPGFQEFFGVKDNYKLIKTFDRKLKDFGPFVFSNSYSASYATVVRVFERI